MRRTLIITSIILAGLLGLYFIYWFFAPGSYAYAEIYKLNYSETEVISAINKLKTDHPELIVPIDIQDGRKDSTDHWYHTYFYYKDKNEIIYCWTRPSNKMSTDFAFVGINAGLALGHWKDINHDFGFFENRNIKKEFETRIFQELKKQLNKEYIAPNK
jgi:hypothetical protein